jgi:hypothetical protein
LREEARWAKLPKSLDGKIIPFQNLGAQFPDGDICFVEDSSRYELYGLTQKGKMVTDNTLLVAYKCKYCNIVVMGSPLIVPKVNNLNAYELSCERCYLPLKDLK